jgi:hypothetical protein
MEHHIGKAREAGADESSIREAIEIGWMVRRGATARFQKDTGGMPGGE